MAAGDGLSITSATPSEKDDLAFWESIFTWLQGRGGSPSRCLALTSLGLSPPVAATGRSACASSFRGWHEIGQAQPVRISVNRRALAQAVGVVLGPPTRDLALFTLRANETEVTLSYSDGLVEAEARLPGEIEGIAAFHVGGRMLGRVLGAARGEIVELTQDDDHLEIRSGRSRFQLFSGRPLTEPRHAPAGGVTVNTDEYLDAFRSVVSMVHGTDDVSDELIRIASSGSDLRLDFHTFDFASTDVVKGQAGSVGHDGVTVRTSALSALIARFSSGVSRMRVVPSVPSMVWFIGDMDKHEVSIEASTRLSADAGRSADQLLTQDRPHVLEMDASRLRGALNRCDVVHRGGSTGRFVTFRAGADDSTCWLLTQGWSSSAAEAIACARSGPDVEFALRFADLAAALRPVKGTVRFSIGEPGRPVVLSGNEHYRCLLRPLAPRPDHDPRFADSSSNVPFPVDRH